MKQKSIKLNFVMNMVLTMSSFLFPLITFPYISRILLPEGTGKVSFASSLISYFSMFAQLGIPTYGIRACAKVRDDRQELTRVAQELLIINLVMSSISYVALFAAIAWVPRLQREKPLYVIISLTILLTSIGMEWLYKALEQYRKRHKGAFTLQRYKGLGEMDATQLWETTLNPETRILKQVEIEDARMASEVTELLMGTEVPPRKAFIYEHATDAELDI